jgi:predicted ABC-type transport system involved in lysophospholipase L1 biosynthesis ATPase subunit
MDEVFHLSDRITVLRDGQFIATRNTRETNPAEITHLMVGRDIESLDLGPRSPIGETILAVKNLSLAWPGHARGYRLKEVSFELRRGEVLGIAGLMGAGRTELLESLFGASQLTPTGEIWLDGQAVHTLNDDQAAAIRARDIGFVFQAFHLLAHLRLWQNVAIPMLLGACEIGKARAAAESMLDRVGLGSRVEALPRELSGGEQQRVALARALVHSPRLILADEPTGNLDPRTAAQALALIDEQVRERGAALLMVTHSARLAARLGRRLNLAGGVLS